MSLGSHLPPPLWVMVQGCWHNLTSSCEHDRRDQTPGPPAGLLPLENSARTERDSQGAPVRDTFQDIFFFFCPHLSLSDRRLAEPQDIFLKSSFRGSLVSPEEPQQTVSSSSHTRPSGPWAGRHKLRTVPPSVLRRDPGGTGPPM